MSEHPPIPGVELGADEQIIDHGTLLGYEWWITKLPEQMGEDSSMADLLLHTDRYVADFIIPTYHPAAQAYKLEGIYVRDIDRAMGIPYNDDMPHTHQTVPDRGLVRITCSSHFIRHKVDNPHAAVFNHMRSLILGYHQADTYENEALFKELREITFTIASAEARRDHLLDL